MCFHERTSDVAAHYKCWRAKDLRNPKFEKIRNPGVSLDDQFFADPDVQVIRPELICNAVDKNGKGINDPTTHQCCYKIKGQKLDPKRTLEITDPFGTYQWQATGRPRLLCQPCSTKDLP